VPKYVILLVGPIVQSYELVVPAFASPFRLALLALMLIVVDTGGSGGGSSGSDSIMQVRLYILKKLSIITTSD